MSAAFGGPRGSGSKAPEKGVFPLDHFAECQKVRYTRTPRQPARVFQLDIHLPAPPMCAALYIL